MLEIVQFENGRYGLQNSSTGILIDREWRTIWGANRARRKRSNSFSRVFQALNKRTGKA